MGPKDKELLKRLLATFKVEAEEHLNAISSGLIELEKASSPEKQGGDRRECVPGSTQLERRCRAPSIWFKVEGACQSLESLFAQLKSREMTLSPELFDHLHQMVDALSALLSASSTEAAHGDEARTCRTPRSSQSAPQIR